MIIYFSSIAFDSNISDNTDLRLYPSLTSDGSMLRAPNSVKD